MATRAANRQPAIDDRERKLANFIATVQAQAKHNQLDLGTSHWLIQAKDLARATEIAQERITNTNRTIPAVINELIEIALFQSEACKYLRRSQNCFGHKERTPLAQARGGNEVA